MVDNLAEKVNDCTVCIHFDPEKLPVIRSSRVSAVQELLISIEANGRTVGTFKIVRYIVGVRC